MAASHWSGPGYFGPNKDPGDPNAPYNQGTVGLAQFVNLPVNTGGLKTEVEIFVPPGCRLSAFDIDVLTAFDSATSATLSIGTTSGGTDYVSGVNVKAATGRIAPTLTAAQLAAMSGQSVLGVAAPIPGPLFITITSVGQPANGYVTVAVKYYQIV